MSEELDNGTEVAQFELVTFEKIKEQFVADLVQKPYDLWQVGLSNSARLYIEFVEGDSPRYYWGTTTAGALIPKGKNFDIWRDKMGRERALEIFRCRSVYGTFMHTEFANWWINGSRPNRQIQSDLKQHMHAHEVNMSLYNEGYVGKIGWGEEIIKDVMAHTKWALDYDIEPVAIELALRSYEYGIASRLDLVHYCNDKNYKKTEKEKRGRHLAYTDWKSGKSGFFKENVIQANYCVRIWNENYPDNQITQCYNFAPKEFKTNSEKPYLFTNQTGKVTDDRLLALSIIGKEDMKSFIQKSRLMMPLEFERGVNPNDAVIETSIHELVESGKWAEYSVQPDMSEILL